MRTINDTISQQESKKRYFSLLESKASKAALQKVLYGHIKFKAIQKFNDPIQKIKNPIL